MAKKIIATPAVEATAGVTSKEEAVTNTSTNAEATTTTQEVSETTAENAEQAELIKDLVQKLEAAQKENINLKDALEKCQADLDQSVVNHTETLGELTIRNLQFKTLQESIVTAQLIDTDEVAEAKTYFDYNGRRYGFTDRAPKKLSFDGQLLTQEELLNDEDAMTSLIVGESAFVKRII